VSVEKTWTVGLSMVAAIETRASVLGAQGMQSPAPIRDVFTATRAACLRTGFCLAICDARG
jgi:hypothetical protein